jgi:hypothetical protein
MGETHDWQLKQEKLSLSSTIDDLEAIAEIRSLIMHEIDIKSHIMLS